MNDEPAPALRFQAVVFDCFGVLCSEVGHLWLARTFAPAEAEEIVRTLFVAVDRGRISEDALFTELGRRASRPAARVEREWRALLTMHDDVLALVRRLRSHCPLGLLTNAGSGFVRGILRDHDLEGLFDAIVVSSEIGCAKPDPAVFLTMLAALDVEAASAVMIDDNPRNIAAAESVGMHGLVFSSAAELERALLS